MSFIIKTLIFESVFQANPIVMIQFIPLLTIQTFAAVISFIAGALVTLVVFFLIFTSSKEEDKTSAKHKVYKMRGRYFFGLVLSIVIVLLLTLRLLPYEKFQGTPEETVTVVAMQWMWKMGPGLSDKKPAEFGGAGEITLPANKMIRFVVTSSDVNHSFGIYNSKGVLVTQTQAMPQYNNILEHVFDEKGEYHILCLEYCGLPHGLMVGKININ